MKQDCWLFKLSLFIYTLTVFFLIEIYPCIEDFAIIISGRSSNYFFNWYSILLNRYAWFFMTLFTLSCQCDLFYISEKEKEFHLLIHNLSLWLVNKVYKKIQLLLVFLFVFILLCRNIICMCLNTHRYRYIWGKFEKHPCHNHARVYIYYSTITKHI